MLRNFERLFLGVLLSLLISLYERRFARATGEQLADLKNAGYIGNVKNLTVATLYQKSREANLLHSKGRYFDAVRIHRECLQEVYRVNEVIDPHWTPPFLSYYFGSFLGHRAIIALIVASQRIGLINSRSRTILHSGGQNEEQLKILFSRTPEITLLGSRFAYRAFEGPMNWHLSERLWLIKTHEGLLETQQFTDYAFQKLSSVNLRKEFEFPDEYEDHALQLLIKYGLPREQPFVAMHVRKKNWNMNDIRQADVRGFIPAASELLKRGYWIIQIGTDPQEPILNDPRVIVIQGDIDDSRFLTPYVLAKAEFLVNTCSGPSYLAAILGTPVLQTNVIAFGKSATTLSSGSLHLPKKWTIKGKPVGLYDLLSSPLGYTYENLRELRKRGLSVEENSADEVRDATCELLGWIERGRGHQEINMRVSTIRRETQAPTNGLIASSYLAKHSDWFLR